MADEIVTLVAYSNLMEAQLARNQLVAEGILVEMTGETGGALLPGMEHAYGHYQLLVRETELDRAAAVLGLDVEEELPPEEEDEPDAPETAFSARGEEGFRASQADEPPPATSLRPRSFTDFPAKVEASDASPAPEEFDDDELAEKVNRRLTYSAEELATRAFRTAALGTLLVMALSLVCLPCFFVPALVVAAYSLWLLVRMAMLPEEVSTMAMVKVYTALAIDAALILVVLVYLRVLLLQVA